MNKRHIFGFTAIELISVLFILSFIFGISFTLIKNMQQYRRLNEVVDQTNKFSQIAIKYLTDNYRQVAAQAKHSPIIIPFSMLNAYLQTDSIYLNKNNQMPCLYVTADLNNSITAFLIYGNNGITSKQFSYLELGKIARNIGANAGILVKNSSGYTVTGGMINNYNFSSEQIGHLALECTFTSIADNTLIVDLSKNNNLFAAIKSRTDRQVEIDNNSPALNKSGNIDTTTMQTNLYFDNTIKESGSEVFSYCDATKLPQPDAAQLCQEFAGTKYVYATGTAFWTGSLPEPGNPSLCLSSAKADFAQIVSSFTCQGVNYGDVNSFCGIHRGGEDIVPDTAYWQINVNNPIGSTCQAYGHAQYQQLSNCNYKCYDLGIHNLFSCPPMDQSDPKSQNLNNLCDTGGGWWPRGVGAAPVGTPVGHNQCHVEFWCSNTGDNYSRASGNINANTFKGHDVNCGTTSVDAITTSTQIPVGAVSCGSIDIRAFESTKYFPTEHVYKALDFGQNSFGKEIQIKSDAPNGAPSVTSQLDINNAGIQAGYIAPVSTVESPVTVGVKCSRNTLGEIVQQYARGLYIIGGQLQCTYNPAYCQGADYCYLPTKTTSFMYKFVTPHISISCPVGTLVANEQPVDGISREYHCAEESGLSLQGLIGEPTNCYTNAMGVKFCTAYRTVCSYKGQNGEIRESEAAALLELKCTNSSTSYTIDNYRPGN